jgi:hypothetical protein
MGRDRLASVSFPEGINANVGFVDDEVFVTSNSRHTGDEPCNIGGCNWKAWIGNASRNSCDSINGCRKGCAPNFSFLYEWRYF